MDIQTNIGKRRAVCFSKDRYIIFKGLHGSDDSGCVIRHYVRSQDDILINDSCVVCKVSVDFEKLTNTSVTKIKTISNEFKLCSWVNNKVRGRV